MDLAGGYPLLQRGIERLRPEHGAAPVELEHVARDRLVPAAVEHPLREHGVEQPRTRRRQQQRALRPVDPAAGEHRAGGGDVAAIATEALLAEVVRHPARRDRVQPAGGGRRIARHLAQQDAEAIAGERAARQLALVAGGEQHAGAVGRQGRPVRLRALAQVHGEMLARHRVAVLQPGVADRDRRHAGDAGQAPGDPRRVGATLLDPQEGVLAGPRGFEAQQFVDLEVLRLELEPGPQRRPAMGPGQFGFGPGSAHPRRLN